MRFSKDFPDKLRSSILTSEIVGKKVALKLRGKEFHGLCPFHNEKTPSFTVNDQKGFYHCFGCGAHGDLISFVMNTEGLEFKDAIIKIAGDFGIEVPQVRFDEAREVEFEQKLERDFLILEKICQFFEKNLYEEQGTAARNYLKKRKLTSAIAKKFRLGFAPNSYETLINFLKAEGFSDLEIQGCGIVGKNDKQKLYDKFRNRVTFAICDKKNRVMAFGGRTIGDDMPKYLNSAETQIFKKNQTLYNFDKARKPIFEKGFAVVVEGYMDAIALFANGIENVVAGLGTALSEEHLKNLFHITDRVVICLDGDSAGMRAAKRASEIALPLVNAKKNIAFTFLPNQMDPDDFINQFGAKELEKLFANATPLSESLFEFALIELGIDKNQKISAENKAKIEANLTAKIAVINDVSSKKYFSFFFKDLLFTLGRGQKKTPENNFGGFNNKKIFTKIADNFADSLAKNIIAMTIKFPELARFRDDTCNVKEMEFSNQKLTELKNLVIETIEHEETPTQVNLLEALEKSEFDNDIGEIKNLLARLGNRDLELAPIKFRILLLKNSLNQVEQQYKESLEKIDEIETHQSAITNQKIKEIFNYKNSLQQMISALEKEII